MTNREVLDRLKAHREKLHPVVIEHYSELEIIIDALEKSEKQIPKKVWISPHSDYDDHERRYLCGNCYNAITGNPMPEDDANEEKKAMTRFCPICGQAIDWTEEEFR